MAKISIDEQKMREAFEKELTTDVEEKCIRIKVKIFGDSLYCSEKCMFLYDNQMYGSDYKAHCKLFAVLKNENKNVEVMEYLKSEKIDFLDGIFNVRLNRRCDECIKYETIEKYDMLSDKKGD